MAIEIYSYRKAEPEAMFPSMQSEMKLVAVAPFEQRTEVELWCHRKNEEAEEADVRRRYGYNVTDVQIWPA